MVVPLLAYLATRFGLTRLALTRSWGGNHWAELRFFAGFCLIANGAYLSAGSFGRVGDAGALLDLGTPLGLMIGGGLGCVVIGLTLWHRLGPQFGWGTGPSQPQHSRVGPLAVAAPDGSRSAGSLLCRPENPPLRVVILVALRRLRLF